MPNKYVSFVSDAHLLQCVSDLYDTYERTKLGIDKTKFYDNKIDTIKMTFDANFNAIGEEDLINTEIRRQVDKTINNAIGYFHEAVLGGITGFEQGNQAGYDIKANDNSLFADLKNKHNTMNSSATEKLYQKLIDFADDNPTSKCYWVQILAKSSFDEQWVATFGKNEKQRVYNHPRVFKISGDKFYSLLSSENEAFSNLYRTLPKVIADFLASKGKIVLKQNTAFDEIKASANKAKNSLIDQITFENFPYYDGF